MLVIRDGWGRDDIDLLEREMARLKRHCHRLIWLNPPLGAADYQPLTRGILAALPHIDDFLPVHNLTSLKHLADLDRRSNGKSYPVLGLKKAKHKSGTLFLL